MTTRRSWRRGPFDEADERWCNQELRTWRSVLRERWEELHRQRPVA
jgi:hypothetical protein